MYENVLREAIRSDELRQWINAQILVRIWRNLNLPGGVRKGLGESLRPAALGRVSAAGA
jgi:hypothetical protein